MRNLRSWAWDKLEEKVVVEAIAGQTLPYAVNLPDAGSSCRKNPAIGEIAEAHNPAERKWREKSSFLAAEDEQ